MTAYTISEKFTQVDQSRVIFHFSTSMFTSTFLASKYLSLVLRTFFYTLPFSNISASLLKLPRNAEYINWLTKPNSWQDSYWQFEISGSLALVCNRKRTKRYHGGNEARQHLSDAVRTRALARDALRRWPTSERIHEYEAERLRFCSDPARQAHIVCISVTRVECVPWLIYIA